MKTRSIFAALLLMVAGMQTAWAQGFRVYKSDGTIVQFSLRTDSIVFYDGLGSDEDFGPFTPVNQCIVGTWYNSKSQSVTFNEDGTTDYMEGATYKFMPYQGNIIIYNSDDAPIKILKVYDLKADQMTMSTRSDDMSIWTRKQQQKLVTQIVLSEATLSLNVNDTKRLTATVLPEDADNKEVTWESSDKNIATIDQTGNVTAIAEGSCIITCSATDGSGVKAECQVTVSSGTYPDPGNHAWVDLGLPSGTLWATCNVGAGSPEEYGDYFAWGETEPKENYLWSNYKYCQGSGTTITKYCTGSSYGTVDNKKELEPEDDAATKNWGSDWQMPSTAQQQELIDNCTCQWTQQNGVNGILVTGRNGGQIFLPAAGSRWRSGVDGAAGGYGSYWSSSLSPDYDYAACRLSFTSSYWFGGGDYYSRSDGFSVRPVRVQTR